MEKQERLTVADVHGYMLGGAPKTTEEIAVKLHARTQQVAAVLAHMTMRGEVERLRSRAWRLTRRAKRNKSVSH